MKENQVKIAKVEGIQVGGNFKGRRKVREYRFITSDGSLIGPYYSTLTLIQADIGNYEAVSGYEVIREVVQV